MFVHAIHRILKDAGFELTTLTSSKHPDILAGILPAETFLETSSRVLRLLVGERRIDLQKHASMGDIGIMISPDGPQLPEQDSFGGGNWVAVHSQIIASVTSTEQLLAIIKQLICANVNPAVLSPYQFSLPAQGRMFVGRRELITSLLTHQQHQVIIGPQLAGKSSLAIEVQRRYRIDAPPFHSVKPGDEHIRSCAYINAKRFDRTDYANELWDSIVKQCGVEVRHLGPGARHKMLWTPVLSLRDEKGRPILDANKEPIQPRQVATAKSPQELLRQIIGYYRNLRLLVIIDECDEMLPNDAVSKYSLFSALRELADFSQGRLRVCLIGHEQLFDAFTTDFPFSNVRATQEWLPQLTQAETQVLISMPLNDIGITLQSPGQVVTAMWGLTGGWPHLIQVACSLLVKDPEVIRARIVKPDSVYTLSKNALFTTQVMFAFNQLSSPLAKMIAYVCAEPDDDNRVLTWDQLFSTCRQHGGVIDETDLFRADKLLRLYGIFPPMDSKDASRGGILTYVNARLRELVRDRLRELGRDAVFDQLSKTMMMFKHSYR